MPRTSQIFTARMCEDPFSLRSSQSVSLFSGFLMGESESVYIPRVCCTGYVSLLVYGTQYTWYTSTAFRTAV